MDGRVFMPFVYIWVGACIAVFVLLLNPQGRDLFVRITKIDPRPQEVGTFYPYGGGRAAGLVPTTRAELWFQVSMAAFFFLCLAILSSLAFSMALYGPGPWGFKLFGNVIGIFTGAMGLASFGGIILRGKYAIERRREGLR